MAADDRDLPCNFLAPTVIEASTPAEPNGIAKMLLCCAAPIYRQVRGLLSPSAAADATEAPPVSPIPEIADLNLEPGEWVEVRPIEEITATLNAEHKYKGLYFMPAMADYCGGRFRVFKKVKTIKLEDTGEVRQLKSPTVFLEGTYCNGERHQGCDRACFHFWREAWLRRAPSPETPSTSSDSAADV